MTRPRRPRLLRAAKAGDLLAGLLHGWGLNERLRQYRALLIWDEVVGPQIAARTRPEKIRDGVLEVCVDQPVWMQQLQLLKPKLLAKLNSRLGEGTLRDLFLKRGRVTSPLPAHTAPAPDWQQEALSPDEEADLRQLLTGVRDEALRQELGTLLCKQVKLSKARDRN